MRCGVVSLIVLAVNMASLFGGLSITEVAIAQDAQPDSMVLNLDDSEPVDNVVDRRMTVTVRDGDVAKGGPSFSVELWQGECRLDLKLGSEDVNRRPSILEIIDGSHGRQARCCAGGVEHLMYRKGESFEWEMTLQSRPLSNQLSFDIETCGLAFYRQDTLTQYAREILGARRPDSVVGGWVAYHASKVNDRIIVSDTQTTRRCYRTGQAFIIYRPRAWDRTDTVWCEMFIDTLAGELTLTLDPLWLDSARYPITIDPTFGNSSIGASTLDWNENYAYCHILSGINTYTVPAGKSASITAYSVYGSESGAGNLSVNMAAFDIVDGDPDSRVAPASDVTVSGGTPGWFHSSSVDHPLQQGNEYGLAIGCAPRPGGIIYYNDVSLAAATDNVNCDLSSESWTQTTQTAFNMSMYATYTEQTVAVTAPTRRRKLIQQK